MTGPDIPEMTIGGRRVGPDRDAFIIAEIGINHEGDAESCVKLIDAAAAAGADAVKLQIIDPEENYAPGTESHSIFAQAWIPPERMATIFAHARERGIRIFATTGDPATFDWVDRLDPVAHKISSGLLTALPIIRRAARSGRPVLLSTGMADDVRIDAAVAAARSAGAIAIGLFQCTSLYPCPPARLNLGAIGYLAERHCVPTGLSDHSVGIEAAPLAVAAGACLIEKHFSLDVGRPGFDHAISLSPRDFARMVELARAATRMIGRRQKVLADDERAQAMRFHRFIAARRDIKAGAAIVEDDIGLFRLPPDSVRGLDPSAFDSVVGRHATRDIPRFSPLTAKDIE